MDTLSKGSDWSFQENHLFDPGLVRGAIWIVLDLLESIILLHEACHTVFLCKWNFVEIHRLQQAVGTFLDVLEPLQLVDLLEWHQLDVRDPLQGLVQIIIRQEVSSNKTLNSICLGLTSASVVSQVFTLAG